MNETDAIPRQRADRRQLQQIIAGLTEGVILVDPDQTVFWANEAALAMHGVEKLEELGATVTEYRERFELQYRNNHKLSPGDYPMDRLSGGEEFSDVIVEVTRTGEPEPRWVHRIRSLVLTDTAGDPDCLVLVLHDATERFSAEERFEKTFSANPAPAIICRLSDLRYIKVNLGFQEITGYKRDDIIGRSVYEIDVLEGAESREFAIERLNEARTIPQMEARLRLPDGGSKGVIVAGQPIEVGDEGCMLFTFMDLEPRKKVAAALRQSEERFSKSFRLMPVPTTISTMPGFQMLDVNDAFVATTGYAAEEVIGRGATEIDLWNDLASRRQLERELEQVGSIRNADIQMKTRDGASIDCLLSAETVAIDGQTCVLSVMQDITERKRSELELMAAIEAVRQDTSWFSRTVIEKLANLRQPHGSNRPRAGLQDLTARERDVLALVCQGRSDREIAEGLGLSRNTIRNQIAAIYGRTDVHHRGALVAWARERGFTGDRPREMHNPKRRTKVR
jgi:PAS domain S-box-containing protein